MRYVAPEQFGAFYFVLLGTATVLLFAAPNPRILGCIWRRPWAVLAVSLLNGAMVCRH